MEPKIILVTGASSGLGAVTAQALADAGHTVYVGASSVRLGELDGGSRAHGGQVHPVALDMADQRSVAAAVAGITARAGRIDVVIHTMGPVPRGPVESFTPYQLAQIYDAHVLSAQRVNRAVLPQMRERREGLLVWVVSSGHHADAVPYLTLHAQAVAAIDHLGSSYGRELADFGIETTIVDSGSLMPDLGRRQRMVYPDDTDTAHAYEHQSPGLLGRTDVMLAEQALVDASVVETARAIASVVDSPRGARPQRIAVGLADVRSETRGVGDGG
jgi:NAD(P)-dependent dehydrogenase (short-subunit alcohol dehydrogenase family)